MKKIYSNSGVIEMSDLSKSIMESMEVTMKNMYGVTTAEDNAKALYEALNIPSSLACTEFLKDSQQYSAVDNILNEINSMQSIAGRINPRPSMSEEIIKSSEAYANLIGDSHTKDLDHFKWLEDMAIDSVSQLTTAESISESVAMQYANLIGEIQPSALSLAETTLAEVNSRLMAYEEIHGLPKSYIDTIKDSQLKMTDRSKWIEDISIAPMTQLATEAVVGNLALASSVHNDFIELLEPKKFDTLKGFENITNATTLSRSVPESIDYASQATDQFTETMKSVVNNVTSSSFDLARSINKSKEISAFEQPSLYIESHIPKFEIDMPIIDFDPKNTPHYRQQEELIEHIKEGNQQELEEAARRSEEKIKDIQDSNKKHKQVLSVGIIGLIITVAIYVIGNYNKDSELIEVKQKSQIALNLKDREKQEQKLKYIEEISFLKQELSEKSTVIKELLKQTIPKKNIEKIVK